MESKMGKQLDHEALFHIVRDPSITTQYWNHLDPIPGIEIYKNNVAIRRVMQNIHSAEHAALRKVIGDD